MDHMQPSPPCAQNLQLSLLVYGGAFDKILEELPSDMDSPFSVHSEGSPGACLSVPEIGLPPANKSVVHRETLAQ